jgi:ABC-type glycerol-3-phosphate transport system substrate-binding protein
MTVSKDFRKNDFSGFDDIRADDRLKKSVRFNNAAVTAENIRKVLPFKNAKKVKASVILIRSMAAVFVCILLCSVILLGVANMGPARNAPIKTKEVITPPQPCLDMSIYIWWDSDAISTNIISDAIKDFLDIYPDYADKSIEIYTPSAMDRDALEIQIAGKTAPSIVKMDQVDILGRKGQVDNLAEYGAERHKDKFMWSAWKAVSYNDEIYGLPFDVSTTVYANNNEILKQMGKITPKTLEEQNSLAQHIIELGQNDLFGYGEMLSYPSQSNDWVSFFWRMGAEILSEDKSQAAFNTPEGAEALNALVDIKKNYKIAPGSSYENFLAGRLAGSPVKQRQFDKFLDEKYAFSSMPFSKAGVLPFSELDVRALCVISEYSGNCVTSLSYKLVEFLATNAQYQADYCAPKNLTPALLEAQQMQPFKDNLQKLFIDQASMSKVCPAAYVNCWPQITEIMDIALYEVEHGKMSAEQALDKAAKAVNDQLKVEWESKNPGYEKARLDRDRLQKLRQMPVPSAAAPEAVPGAVSASYVPKLWIIIVFAASGIAAAGVIIWRRRHEK